MKTTMKNLQTRLDELGAAHRAAVVEVERARAELEKQEADHSVPRPVVEGSDLLDRPQRWHRVATAEAALALAQRRADGAAAEVERCRETIAAVQGARVEIEAYERAVGPAVELDSEMTAAAVVLMRELADRSARLQKLQAAAMDAWTRIPLAARDGVQRAALSWLLGASESMTDRLPRALRRVS